MYSLLYFTDCRGSEYVVIASDRLSPSEHAKPRHELKYSVDLVLGRTGDSMIAMFPIDEPLVPDIVCATVPPICEIDSSHRE